MFAGGGEAAFRPYSQTDLHSFNFKLRKFTHEIEGTFERLIDIREVIHDERS